VPSVFSRIIAGELPAHYVWEDPSCVAFLSINPLRPGHVLVVPRLEIDDWLDLEDDLRDHLFKVAQTIGRALKQAYRAPKVGVLVAGLEVPHVHIHLVPIYTIKDLDTANVDPSPSAESLEQAAELIRGTLAAWRN
jgi:histidine triad (HIT) family protein